MVALGQPISLSSCGLQNASKLSILRTATKRVSAMPGIGRLGPVTKMGSSFINYTPRLTDRETAAIVAYEHW